MSLLRDKQIKNFLLFLVFFSFLCFGAGLLWGTRQIGSAKAMYIGHDEAVASALLERGISREAAAAVLTNTEVSEAGQELLAAVGIGKKTDSHMLPFVDRFRKNTFSSLLVTALLLGLILALGTFAFLRKRNRLYEQAQAVLGRYIDGDYSCHLPQNSEGALYQVFTSVEQLATMLQAEKEAEQMAKDFLKKTISDISHQLKTPLAALNMYQEIIEEEPDNEGTVRAFSAKIGASLKRMERLIQSMLKITRLDTGNIAFAKSRCPITELIARSVNELMVRARNEGKQIVVFGDPEQEMVCDPEWTGEALENIVKNALDYTVAGGVIRITWERTPTMLHIFVSDNGRGIAPEDIHHIFKRFYRSAGSLETQGIGLGLSLAKSIVEGQGGRISVQSERNQGTTFLLSFLAES